MEFPPSTVDCGVDCGADPDGAGISPESAEIAVEIAYALPQRAVVKTFRLPVPATIAEALTRARGDADYVGVDWDRAAVGIFGLPAPPERILRDGDRIEIYRPLAVDPKTARRARSKTKETGSPRPR